MRYWRTFALLLVVAVGAINLWRTGLEAFHWPRSASVNPGGSGAASPAAMISAGFAVAFAGLGGTLLASLLWPRRGEAVLVASVGASTGLGLTSLLYHFGSLLSDRPLPVIFPLELLASCVLLFLWLGKMRTTPAPARPKPVRSWLGTLVLGVFAVGGAIAAYSLVVTWRAVPAELCGASLPGALPLVAATVARITAYSGTSSSFASGLCSAGFSLATLGLLVAGVHRLRNRLISRIGGLLLLGTPFFCRFTPVEHADVPFGFFLLAATVLTSLARDEGDRGLMFLAGLAAGLAAWTKPEGLLFCAVLGIVAVLNQQRTGSWRNLPALLGGLALIVIPLLGFRLTQISPGPDTAGISGLVDWSRHRLIFLAAWRDLPRFGEWYSLPFLVMVLPLIGPGRAWRDRRIVRTLALPGLLLAASYSAYLVGPVDLPGHLAESLSRLLLQIWPSAIFLWCLLAVRVSPSAGQTSPVVSPADSPPSGQSA